MADAPFQWPLVVVVGAELAFREARIVEAVKE
jgi:hypothetical protein